MPPQIQVAQLLKDVDTVYSDAVKRGCNFTQLSVTRDKIMQARGWEASDALIQANFDSVLTELQVAYVPRQLIPGPLFLFPISDSDGEFHYAQSKPLEGSVFYGGGKYHFFGSEPVGARWLGNSPRILELIVKRGLVIVVEGPFDLLACRLLVPEAPVLCPLTKTLRPKHIAYLRIFNTRNLVFMFDNEGKQGENKGTRSALYQARQVQKLPRINTRVLPCPAKDPAEALRSLQTARKLKAQLENCYFGL